MEQIQKRPVRNHVFLKELYSYKDEVDTKSCALQHEVQVKKTSGDVKRAIEHGYWNSEMSYSYIDYNRWSLSIDMFMTFYDQRRVCHGSYLSFESAI